MSTMSKVWVVEMLRWGEREMHSYVIGVFSSEDAAIEAGKEHRDYRGGKYEAEVSEFTLDEKG